MDFHGWTRLASDLAGWLNDTSVAKPHAAEGFDFGSGRPRGTGFAPS